MALIRNALAVALLAGAGIAWAQQGPARLQCDGKYSDFLRGTRDAESRGGYVEVGDEIVKIVAIPGFEATYKVTTRGDKAICFALPSDKAFQGCINRFSGQLSLSKLAAKPRPGDHGKLDLLWYGNCRTAKPLF